MIKPKPLGFGYSYVRGVHMADKKLSENAKKSIIVQGSILALAGIVSKIIGFIYRIPMANIMGNTGNGIYSVAFGIYNIALTLSSYSMPLAVSKLMSARIAKKEYKNANNLFMKAMVFAIITGFVAFITLFLGADILADLYKKQGLERPIRILAPTTFIVAMLGTCRGFFQGHRNMVPTAVSQVVEQIVNAIVSVLAAYLCVQACSNGADKSSYGAMGGTMGTLAGALVALIIFIGLFIKNRPNYIKEMSYDDEATESSKIIYKAILLTVIPVIISQTIYQLGYTLDDLIFGNLMCLKGINQVKVTDLQGVFNTQYNQMINLPTAIATSMAAATLPSIVASYTTKEYDSVYSKINTVIKVNMLIAVPSAIGLAVLADPIMSVLFPGLNEYHTVAVKLLMTGSFAVVCYALSTMTTSILQGCDKMRTPVIHSGISLVIHVGIVAGLVYYTDLGVYGLVIGNVTFPMLVSILNMLSIHKHLNYKFEISNSFVKPLIAAIIMGIITYASYNGLMYIIGNDKVISKLISMGVAFVLAIITYAVMIGVLKVFKKEELAKIPVLKKIVK